LVFECVSFLLCLLCLGIVDCTVISERACLRIELTIRILNIKIRENGMINDDNASAINHFNLSSSWQSTYGFEHDNAVQNNKLKRNMSRSAINGDERFWIAACKGYWTAA
jgi:hypothetical protein